MLYLHRREGSPGSQCSQLSCCTGQEGRAGGMQSPEGSRIPGDTSSPPEHPWEWGWQLLQCSKTRAGRVLSPGTAQGGHRSALRVKTGPSEQAGKTGLGWGIMGWDGGKWDGMGENRAGTGGKQGWNGGRWNGMGKKQEKNVLGEGKCVRMGETLGKWGWNGGKGAGIGKSGIYKALPSSAISVAPSLLCTEKIFQGSKHTRDTQQLLSQLGEAPVPHLARRGCTGTSGCCQAGGCRSL